MANSKNTKKDRDEKKSSDLSELNDSYSTFGADNDSEAEGSEFISKYSAYTNNDETDYPKSAYASKINKSFGQSAKNKNNTEEDADDSYTSQFGNDQRGSRKTEQQFKTENRRQYSGSRTHQLSYDQQGRYQQPVQEYNRQFGQPRDTRYDQNRPYEYGQGISNQAADYRNRHNQRYGYNQQQNDSYASNQEYFQQPDQRYDRRQFHPSGFSQSQGYNQSYNYGNQYSNQQFINRGYENHNYNDQNNGLRSSYNTQGFGNAIYRHETDHPEYGGSGYAGSTFGGQGSGEFRSNEHNYQGSYYNPEFTSRKEFRNPSKGYTRNYRQEEQQRNNYQHDEDGIKGFCDNYNGNYEDNYHFPYRNEREEQYGYEFSNYHRGNLEDEDRNYEQRRNREQQSSRPNRNRNKRIY